MITLDLGKPNPKQVQFLKADKKYIAFGGARGGGKSWSVRTKAILLCLNYAGIKLLIVRRTYPELINNHINILRPMLLGIAKYNDKDKVLKFGNSSTINFAYCDSDKDLDRLQGQEYDVIFLDEATQLSEYQIKTITACMRGANQFPKRMYFTCNPNGQGLQYVKRLFIDRRFEDKEDPNDYVFIQSLVTDNYALMENQPDYLEQLEALPPKMREAWLYGRWDVYEGQFFEEFSDKPEHYDDRQWTHVINPFEIPDDWTIFRCFDYGYAKPFACEWFAMSHDGVLYNILELYGCTKTANEGVKWIPQKVFAEIHKIETEQRWLKGKNIMGVADPAIWNAEYGESIAETAAKQQVYFSKGDNQRIAGWMQMHYRLAFDENGYPMMYFFKNCKHSIRTLPMLCYDEHKPEDVDTSMEDHIADSIRYLCMNRPIKPRTKPIEDKYKQSANYMYLDIAKEDIVKPKTVERIQILSNGNI